MSPLLRDLRVKIFADGADLGDFVDLVEHPLIAGVTTNPTLMRKAGVADYTEFARELLKLVPHLPVSLEVFADDLPTIGEQARQIASWGENVVVKVPITTTAGEPCTEVLKALASDGVRVNVTALMTVSQVELALGAMENAPAGFISLFAGRIADTGRDPVPIVRQTVELLADTPQIELIWASPRELLNIFQADEAGCHVITVTRDLLAKLPSVGKDLDQFSLETVKMFYDDARLAGYSLESVFAVE